MDKTAKPQTGKFGLNRNVFFMGVVSFLNDCSNEIIHSSFPVFFTSVLHSGAASLGLIEGIADGVSQVMKIFSGRYSDKAQRRKLPAVLGYSLSVLVRPFYIVFASVPGVLTLRVIDRLGKGVREAPRDALISLSVGKEDLGKSFGFHRAMDAAGGIVGPLTAYLILKFMPGNFTFLFGLAFIIGLLAVLSFVFVREVVNIASSLSAHQRKPLPKGFFSALFALFILSLGTLPVAVLLLRSKDLGFDLADIPLFYLIYSFFFSLLSLKAGTLADRLGDRFVLMFGYIILVVSYITLTSGGIISLILGFGLLGLSMALTDGIQRAFVSRMSDPDVRGTAIGYLNGASGMGLVLSGILGGFIWQNYGALYALTGASIVIIVGLVVLIRQINRVAALNR